MNISTFDIFKIGIGPSSSHTVGPMLAALKFAQTLEAQDSIGQTTHILAEMFGSLGATGMGHGTPKAVMLGLCGDAPETVQLDSAENILKDINHQQRLKILGNYEISFSPKEDIILHRKKSLPYHANGMRFTAFHDDKPLLQKDFYSIGGGFICEGAEENNQDKSSHHQLEFPFDSGTELLNLCHKHQMSIANIMLANEMVWQSKENVEQKLDALWQTMQNCIERGLSQEGTLPGGLNVKRRAKKLYERLQKPASTNDPLAHLDWVSLFALAVNEENASGGRIVTAPTNGAAGIIPAVLHYYDRFIEGANRQGIHIFLLTAAAVGTLFKKNASISGAEVGCQGEIGSACSMAAAGLTAVLGGSPEQIENAAEIAMEHHLGLTCDPIGGLVQIPCIERNAVASVKAIHAARMALNEDGSHFVSLDKVIKTMRETGRDMQDKYKETSRGGLATHVIEVPVNIIEC